ncbi:methyltransferase domain-containing protein [Vibrio sp. S4M6]|uniref:methyltransferase domain-containing protein n=1 Tax=Vibrio sinus TaxID=2946865 RepID=UPI002029D9B1|nr:methyltransferase domain-containing protein [Vibrio sinus]MCL9781239.1 methyltransferase domain-containing protein [Vibrio sinus]
MNYDKEYDVNGIVQFDAAKELLKLLPKNVPRVLDVGCGSGKVTQLIREHTSAERIYAIDQSQQMIVEASNAYPSPTVSYIHSSIEDFDLESIGTLDRTVDLVTSNSSFQWFRDHSAALSNIRNTLSNDGVFVLQTPCKENWCPTIVSLIDDFFAQCYPQLKPHHHFPCMHLEEVDDYRQLFAENGFEVDEIYLKTFEYDLTVEDFLKVFKSGAFKVYSYQDWFDVTLPDGYTEALLQFVANYAKNHNQISISMPRVFAKLRKLYP